MDFSHYNAKQRIAQFLDTPLPRHLAEVLRVRYWYQGVKQRTRCKNAYQLERRFEPLTKVAPDTRTPFRNKWIRYQAGKHTPHARLIDLVEAKQFGTAAEFNLPLWQVLQLPGHDPQTVDDWFMELDPQVQSSIYKQPHEGVSAIRLRLAYKPALGRKLVKLGNLDALAALLLYWREESVCDQPIHLCQIAEDIYRLLLTAIVKGVEIILRFKQPINSRFFPAQSVGLD